MKRAGRLTVLDVWLGSHPAIALLPVAVLVLALVALAQLPVGPAQHTSGVLERIDLVASRSRPRAFGSVRLQDGALVTVGLDRSFSCETGDLIRIQRQRRLWGWAYTPEFGPCVAPSGRSGR